MICEQSCVAVKHAATEWQLSDPRCGVMIEQCCQPAAAVTTSDIIVSDQPDAACHCQ